MSACLRILQVEDSPTDAELVQRELQRGGLVFEVLRVYDQASYLEALKTPPDLVLSDFALPEFDGLTALGLLKQRHPDVPFILVSGAIGEDLAVAAMREGAADYLLKDRLSRLTTAVQSAVSRAQLRRENRALEERLLRAARLESLGRLSAGLAHDLNNILLPIMMAEQLLREQLRAPELTELLDMIETSARRGAAVLKQLLMFGRGTSGDRVPVRPSLAIAETEAVLRETFPKNIEVRIVIGADDARILAEPTQLQQVLINLCVNACDAMPGGGTLGIELDRKVLPPELARRHRGSAPGPYVVLSVRDTGVGIRPDDLERIFDPFFTTKELDRGTGLGLSSVLGIVEGHLGFIEVDSELGAGTEFEVWLPEYRGGALEEPVGVALRHPRGRGQLVLVVDDEPAVLDVLGASIGRCGYRVALASDALTALRLLDERGGEVAVVITDIAMPRLDGLHLAGEVRKRRRDLPIIVMTAALTPEDRASCAKLGVDEFLTKPFRTETLLRSLDRALESTSAGAGAM
ncbi:MAG TPA: response regulator [Polyangiaceae bacterium]|nr:response regulator [Polyangiaceae bacterium]